jgi:signal transduction histidine kinase
MAKNEIAFPAHIDLEEKISVWAHDLRSPFNHVLGFTKIVLNGQSGPLTDLQKEDLKTVYISSLRAMALVNNLIEIARLQQGLKEIHIETVELEGFLDRALAQWTKFNPDIEIPVGRTLSTQNGNVSIDRVHTQSVLNGFISYLTTLSNGTGKLAIDVTETDESLVFKLHMTDIAARGTDEMSLEMHGVICSAYITLLQGQICSSEADDSEALILFSIPLAPQQ